MKTMILAAAATVALGIGTAFAGEGDGTSVTTLFTSIPGQQSSLMVSAPGRVAGLNKNADTRHAYVTNSSRGTWLFPPAQGGSGG